MEALDGWRLAAHSVGFDDLVGVVLFWVDDQEKVFVGRSVVDKLEDLIAQFSWDAE
jgi:hypothetical protein